MSATDKPGIAELQRLCAQQASGDLGWSDELESAAPVLLEIVQAAMAWAGPDSGGCEHDALLAALAKVRP